MNRGFDDRHRVEDVVGAEGDGALLVGLGSFTLALLARALLLLLRDLGRLDLLLVRRGRGAIADELVLAQDELDADAHADLAHEARRDEARRVEERRGDRVPEATLDLGDDLRAERGGRERGPFARGDGAWGKVDELGRRGRLETGADEAVEEVRDERRVVARERRA